VKTKGYLYDSPGDTTGTVVTTTTILRATVIFGSNILLSESCGGFSRI
jgi:hypothetical protein